MDTPPASHEASHEEFSLPLFTFTLLASLACLAVLLRVLAPAAWELQFLSSAWKALAAFVLASLANGFVEYFFHRYVLHTSAIPVLRRLYRQHTLHHALTRIGRKKARDGRGILFIENKFPILEPEQGEASFFPWYSMGIFAALATPVLALLQWLLPSFPWFFSGYMALAVSLSLYEVLHAINHWPFEIWEPLIDHPRWAWFWRPVYAFHLRHHAVIDCNESISGFFGLPLADWVFGTCVIPKTVYADGEEWNPEKFRSPQPVWVIRKLDAWARGSVQARRAAKAAPAMGRRLSRGERIAIWITHGSGLALGVVGFTLLIVFASRRGDAWHVVSFTVFGLTLVFLHAVWAIYQARRSPQGKRLFRRLGQAAVFLLIAGAYTPILLTNLRGPWGWSLFGVIWGLCGAGAVFQLFFDGRVRVTPVFITFFTAWLIVLALGPLITAVPPGALWLLLLGGLCYLAGVAFYRLRPVRYRHALWQSFLVAGSTCQILAMLLFILPHGS